MKRILFLLIGLLTLQGYSQNTDPILTTDGATNRGKEFLGAVVINGTLNLPVRNHDSIYTNPKTPYKGRIQLNSETKRLEYHDSIDWRPVVTDFSLYDRMYSLKYPEEFAYRPFQIYRYKTSDWKINATPFETNFEKDFANAIPYYISPSGNDANNGLTPATAKRTIASAYTAGGSLFLISEGIHNMDVYQSITSDGRNIAIVGAGRGKTMLSGFTTEATWSAYNDIYSCTFSNARVILDWKYKNEFGLPERATIVTSIAEVEATPNTWYLDGTTVYFNPIDGRTPDSDIDVYTRLNSSTTVLDAPSGNIYFLDIDFIGRGGAGTDEAGSGTMTVNGIGGTPTVNVYGKNCNFVYGSFEGVRLNNISNTYFENCFAYGNNADGFNYKGDIQSNVIEYNCNAFRNGYYNIASSYNVNGSSSHNGGNVIRINGNYFQNHGPNVADVDGGKTINIMCSAGLSFRNIEPNPNIDFQSLGDGARMWIVDCYAQGYISENTSEESIIYDTNSIYTLFSGDIIPIDNVDNNSELSDYVFNTSKYSGRLTIDATPTDGSNNAVSSNGTFDAILAAITNIGFSTNPISTPDLNTITQSGLYIPSSSAATGLPVANASISIFHMNQTSTAATQMAIRAATGDFWWRAKAGGTWGSWNKGASEAYADAKVADNLTASTTVAPSKTAANAALALKAAKAGDTYTGTHNFTGATTNVATPTYPHSGSQAINGDYLSTAITNLELYKLRPVNTVLNNTDANFTGSIEYNQFVTHTGNTAALEDILPPIDPEYIGVTFWFFNNSTESVLISTATGGFDIIEENITKVSYTLPVGEQVTMRMNGTYWVVVANGL